MIKCTSQPRLLLFYAVHATARVHFLFIIILTLMPDAAGARTERKVEHQKIVFTTAANKRGIACARASVEMDIYMPSLPAM
jgi:hypothetical protein